MLTSGCLPGRWLSGLGQARYRGQGLSHSLGSLPPLPRWLPFGAAALDLHKSGLSRVRPITSGPCLAPVGAAQPLGYRVGGGP